MRVIKRALGAGLLAVGLTAASMVPALAEGADAPDFLTPDYQRFQAQLKPTGDLTAPGHDGALRAAAFNSSLSRGYAGELAQDLSRAGDESASAVAEVIQRTNPDVVLLSDFDYDEDHEAAEGFRTHYLQQDQNQQQAVDYPYMYVAPTNHGVPTGADLDGNGTVGDATDGFGHGDFPGQHGMVLYSKHPIQRDGIRTFQNLLWTSMPDNRLPTGEYSPLVRTILRLNSSTTWDVPVTIEGNTVHVVAVDPGAAVDEEGNEHRRRNADEIRLISDYVAGGGDADYITDDQGHSGGLPDDARFVVLGDLGVGPGQGDSARSATKQLLGNAAVNDPRPTSPGAEEYGAGDPPAPDAGKLSAPNLRTSIDGAAGALRSDYALASISLDVAGAGVFWPSARQPGRALVYGDPAPSGNHRLVWVDIDLPVSD
ncbi:MAG: endonuclease/exonuclease/phosphatase family protein [Arthrobacter sp.]|uniref:endonuclease/exonuclease/phosphatase family protein n=1 Tax=Arthrobacter sp. 179 TaxID=3457734 RepID=UPI00264D1A6E|nr:endonuclease/exonuclease/phosphatase family protein [Micrococcaceae bacterium]MDN5825264.1 endonuclease/exonuclease/phosphatase family protein [Micrococcaceae bacterium]MDN5878013.1 endonuclease/exonuclease/phosphatase family protein [Micrococcaceae bacterium]MDN5885475.1 endonuclease/exonuclease/phosphatase family protein [Micrococcaceae bacterium]MDN5905470.1 endonuclease/exonuclease/phosphatase family protein [Micrococcaceae bacterium]